MKKTLFRSTLCLFLVFLQVFATPVQAAFDHFNSGARGAGMADSMVGIADDSNALYYNPAGLTQLPEGEITAGYGRLLTGLNDGSNLGSSNFGYAQPLRNGELGTLGVGYYQFNADNLFNERMISIGYARIMRNLLKLDGVLSLGFNIKNLNREFQPDRFTENGINDNGIASGQRDALFGKNGYSKSAFAADLSAFYKFGPQSRYTAGAMITNVNQPDVSLANSGDRVPRSTRFGLGYHPSRINLFSAELRRTSRITGSTDVDAAFGAEHRFLFDKYGAFEVRGGYAEGARGFRSVTAGASYIFYKMELDYAMSLPVGTLGDSQETHRLGFTMRLGHGVGMGPTEEKEKVAYSLIDRFKQDPTTTLGIVERVAIASNMSTRQQGVLVQTLLRRYPLDATGADELKSKFAQLLKEPDVEILDNVGLKRLYMNGITDEDRVVAEEGFDRLIGGDSKSALSRWVIMKPETREKPLVKGLITVAYSEAAAQAYRRNDLEATISNVGKLVELMPNDHEIAKAYRDLLNQRSAAYEQSYKEQKQAVAPPPVVTQPTGKTSEMTTYEGMVQSYGLSLGYYLTRKVKGASKDELVHLLQQMKSVYGQFNIDLSVVETELQTLTVVSDEEPVKAPEPVKKVEPQTEAKPKVEKPAQAKPAKKVAPIIIDDTMDPLERAELEGAWNFYKKAVEEGITDRERIQTLESILNRFGDHGTEMVMKELAVLRKKVFGK